MKFFSVLSLLFAGASAMPAAAVADYDACPDGGLFGNPQCCGVDLLNIISVDCRSPVEVPKDAAHFAAICAKSGQRARCCGAAEVADLGLLCQKPVGVAA
ncbi:hypothetical protein MRS44_016071 [Fusarium solani]|uniref:Fungal hydrophobin-domain-containing protein n=1 Tax=Fusarium solani TaxID=169388 RepID=A0A9P9JSE8_FUSSL|nr:fungal hydrophobin-domain-containing protein [Fusarium solani]KAH7230400.1 fungal hydrophobin-domain-containing protein [Fusarium solani]KAJ3456048.1 hypothetical protein MRS44_016071 [Fusarium solani]KAJ4198475.1 hypothetical protein NW759_016307 [Fusarium solani]